MTGADPDLKRYWRWLKSLPCEACRKHATEANPVEVAHIRGIYSDRLRDLSHRSHKGVQGWAALSLCRRCHQQLHAGGEAKFLQLYVPHAHARFATNVLTWFLEEHVEDSMGERGADAEDDGA